MAELPHAQDLLPRWVDAWRESGRLVLLLDFDGTLAPIVERPEDAEMLPATRSALEPLSRRPDVNLAIVSGRGLDDARGRVRLEGLAYAGNHGMEIELHGSREVHEEAASARPELDVVAEGLRGSLRGIAGSIVEDKGLTLSVHYRLVDLDLVPNVKTAVHEVVRPFDRLRVTEGKMVLEIRPRVEWDKGRAVAFLLDRLRPPAGAPVLYLGDDRTDEDAFRELRVGTVRGDGVLVAERQSPESAAVAWLQTPAEVADLLAAFAAT